MDWIIIRHCIQVSSVFWVPNMANMVAMVMVAMVIICLGSNTEQLTYE